MAIEFPEVLPGHEHDQEWEIFYELTHTAALTAIGPGKSNRDSYGYLRSEADYHRERDPDHV